MSCLLILKGSRQSVEKVLDDILEAQNEHSSYDPSRSLSSRGRYHSIDCKKDIDLILNCQMNEISITQTTIILNDFRADDTPARSTLSWSTVAEFVRNSPLIMKSRRAGQKSGSHNPDTEWSMCRHALAQQWLSQLAKGIQIDHPLRNDVQDGEVVVND